MNSEYKRIFLQVLLFITTFFTTTIAGAEWCFSKSWIIYPEQGISINPHFTWTDFFLAMQFSVPFLLILTVHEFGHYFTAIYHKVKTSLPYYIPFPPLPLSIGTMGAVIRLRSRVPSSIKNFDIGIAGPLAGFVMAIAVLVYGFATLPPAEHIYTIHPEYEKYGLDYANHVYSDAYMEAFMKEHDLKYKPLDIKIGSNLLFEIFGSFLSDKHRVPNAHELMHFPFLFAGLLALVFTSLNLLPIGQLDGGHVLYGLVGFRKHRMIASAFFVAFIFYAGLGLEYIVPTLPANDLIWSIPIYGLFLFVCFTGLGLPVKDTIMYAVGVFAAQYLMMLIFPTVTGYSGWLLFGLLLGRLLGIQHPRSEIEEPLDRKRIVLGWIALIVFLLCFTPAPVVIG